MSHCLLAELIKRVTPEEFVLPQRFASEILFLPMRMELSDLQNLRAEAVNGNTQHG
jgi:hypothetical protein